MDIIFYILIVMLALVIWSMFNQRNLLKQLKLKLRKEWGETPGEEYTSEKFKSIQTFYQSIKDDCLDVDDITWHDLDMDEIYMQMNNTQSSMGEEYLYAMLRKPCFSEEELNERDRLMKFFDTHEEKRVEIQVKLNQVGKHGSISIFEYINRLEEQEAKSNLKHYLMSLGLLFSIILIFIIPGLGGVLTLIFAANNIIQYYARKAQIENYLIVFSSISRMLESVNGIHQLEIDEIRQYTDLLRKDTAIFKSFRRLSAFVATKKLTGSIEEMALDYLRMLFHIDLMLFNSLLRFLKQHRQTLNRIYINIGYLDSLIAAASFRNLISYYCEPELIKTEDATGHNRSEATQPPFLSVTDLYHPLIEAPVPNSINEKRSVLVTGSNASGKSTFIKTLAMNAILSQTIYTSVSKRYRASYFMIYSSMALRDNIFNKESYYIVEIKSLKRILDRVNKDIPILCFIDEVLRGTNTLERIAASSRILATLSRQNTLVFAATHDIELTHILENSFSNYHFQERINEKEILFDYKLYQGKAVSKNAIKLLSLLGYPKNLILSAEDAAEEFLSTGEWSKVKN